MQLGVMKVLEIACNEIAAPVATTDMMVALKSTKPVPRTHYRSVQETAINT